MDEVQNVKSVPERFVAKSCFLIKNIRHRRKNIVIVSWHENYLRSKKQTIHINNIFRYIFLLILMRLSARILVRIRHNRYPHGLKKEYYEFYDQITSKSSLFIDHNIIHDLSYEAYNNHTYVPHPLYEEICDPSTVTRHVKSLVRTPYLLIFGKIQNYKKIPEFLELLNISVRVIIAGKSEDPHICKEINSLSNKKSIIWLNKYLNQNELNFLIKNSNGVIVTQTDNNNFVTGNFYHAATFGKPVHMVENGFTKMLHKKKMYDAIYTYKSAIEMAKIINEKEIKQPAALEEEKSKLLATIHFGLKSQCFHWRKVFEKLLNKN